MSTPSSFDSKYWNLAQASAWVEFREQGLVAEFDAPDRDSYLGLRVYDADWPDSRKQYGSAEDLRRALVEGRLMSWGYHLDAQDRLQEIPSPEWVDYVLSPPFAFVAGLSGPGRERRSKIRVLSADMKRLWRSVNEVSGRSKYDWAVIRELYDELQQQNPEMTKNELILELQGAFEERFNKEPPSRSAIQRKIQIWS